MVIKRGEIYWADLGTPFGFTPGFRRPVIIIQSDSFNRSAINTVVACVLTSNLELQMAPGNVLLPKNKSGLKKDSVCNVSQVITLDKAQLDERVCLVDSKTLSLISQGLRIVLDLE